jgi:hypothetical protein
MQLSNAMEMDDFLLDCVLQNMAPQEGDVIAHVA